MFAEIIRELPEGEVLEIVSGAHWNIVVVKVDGKIQCGMASNPVFAGDENSSQHFEFNHNQDGNNAKDLCESVYEQNGPRVSVGLAAINALLLRYPETWIDANAGEEIAARGRGKRVALVGHFPFVDDLRAQVGSLDVLELRPREGDLPASEAPRVIPNAGVVALTSMTLINGTFQSLIDLCSPESYVIMIGPSTPLSPILFDHGVDMLCGSIVENCQPVLANVKKGLSFRKIRPSGVRLVSIRR
jgi:hypothetical protein